PSPQRFVRPSGQSKAPDAAAPVFGPCKRLDFELELGVFIGRGNALGAPVAIAEAEAHAFGLCILNDWSARDIQQWEYQPLGPFLGKSFATTISPWIVTLEALEPYRLAWTREASDPQPLPYLESADNRARGALDVQVEVLLETGQMRGRGAAPVRLARSSYRHAYWTLAQMIAHHTANGCNLTTGDLLGTGTLSGPESDSVCSMLELTQAGREPLKLPGGETRAFLDDGDSVIMRAWCERAGFARIGFGECAGTVLPAR
ncbi:MAG TPA: fumarylacetoacetate hydrolase family protein, partial [Burkholderiales bacterium]|nr:fumarylacetoacetate hydrolase family protein [Burkholderiales bacterium]